MTKLLGMLLVDDGIVTTTQLAEALNYQGINGGFIGEVFVTLGYIDKTTLTFYLQKQKNITGET